MADLPHACDISVLLPTKDRPESLDRTLLSLLEQDTSLSVEVVLVNNGEHVDETETIRKCKTRLNLRLFDEKTPGKSAALNAGLRVAQGSFIAFTDDDVAPSSSWLSALSQAASAYAGAAVFCGPVIPSFPSDPGWLRYHWSASLFFAAFRPILREGLLPPPLLPFGPNFAIRAEALATKRFRTDLGPSSGEPLMSEDTALLRELRRDGTPFVYVPSAVVRHHIRPELLELTQLLDRIFQYGRSVVIQQVKPVLYLPNIIGASRQEIYEFDCGCMVSFLYGQLFQMTRTQRDHTADVLRAIGNIDWSGDPELVAPFARAWLCENAHFIPEHARSTFFATTTIHCLSRSGSDPDPSTLSMISF